MISDLYTISGLPGTDDYSVPLLKLDHRILKGNHFATNCTTLDKEIQYGILKNMKRLINKNIHLFFLLSTLSLITIPITPATLSASNDLFIGVSRYNYFSGITTHLRNPMMRQGKIIDSGFDFQDASVFFDAGYADLFLIAKSGDQYLSMFTIGMGFIEKNFIFYGVLGSLLNYSSFEGSYIKSIIGIKYSKQLLPFMYADLYAQVDIDSAEGVNWEVGVHPFKSRLLSSSFHAFFSKQDPRIIESRNRVLFLSMEYLKDNTLDVSRSSLSLSRRSLAIFTGNTESSSWELELQTAYINAREPQEHVFEMRLLSYFTFVGKGSPGEPRPGFHLNLSYMENNSSPLSGFGVELGFGAKQIDTQTSQQLYFTVFYNYSGYYYRFPSLKYGIGLTAFL